MNKDGSIVDLTNPYLINFFHKVVYHSRGASPKPYTHDFNFNTISPSGITINSDKPSGISEKTLPEIDSLS